MKKQDVILVLMAITVLMGLITAELNATLSLRETTNSHLNLVLERNKGEIALLEQELIEKYAVIESLDHIMKESQSVRINHLRKIESIIMEGYYGHITVSKKPFKPIGKDE